MVDEGAYTDANLMKAYVALGEQLKALQQQEFKDDLSAYNERKYNVFTEEVHTADRQ